MRRTGGVEDHVRQDVITSTVLLNHVSRGPLYWNSSGSAVESVSFTTLVLIPYITPEMKTFKLCGTIAVFIFGLKVTKINTEGGTVCRLTFV